MQWLGDAVGERGKGSVANRDVTHCMGPSLQPYTRVRPVPAVQLTTADNTSPPTLLWEATAQMTEEEGSAGVYDWTYSKKKTTTV